MAKKKINRVLIDPKFIDDVCRRCDKWMSVIKSHHGFIVSGELIEVDPVRYSYKFGHVDLRFTEHATEVDRIVCRSFYGNFLTTFEVLRDLGLVLQFDACGRHYVRYRVHDVLVEEDDI